MDENLKNLKILLSAMSTEHLSKSDFIKHFKMVVEQVNKLKAEMRQAIISLDEAQKQTREQLKGENTSTRQELSSTITKRLEKEINSLQNDFNTLHTIINQKLEMIKDGKDGKDGKDADEKKILKKLLNKVPAELKAEDIRDKLETLIGEERLRADAIDGLEDLIRELTPMRVGGGGTSDLGVQSSLARIVKTETPSGAIDGSNKTYTVQHNINAVFSFGISGEVIHDDEYTISGKTITMTDAIPANLSGLSFRIVYV